MPPSSVVDLSRWQWIQTEGDAVSGRLLRARGPLRRTSAETTAGADVAQHPGVGAAVMVPIVVEGRTWGGLSTVTGGKPVPAETRQRFERDVHDGA